MNKELILTNKTASVLLAIGLLIAGVLGPLNGLKGSDLWILYGIWLGVGSLYALLMLMSPINPETIRTRIDAIPSFARKILVWVLAATVMYYGVCLLFNMFVLVGSALFGSTILGVNYAAKALINGTLTLVGVMAVIGFSKRFQMTQSVFNLLLQFLIGFWGLITLLALLSI